MPVVQTIRDHAECMRLRPVLQAYLDGETEPDLEARVAAHVQACRRCGDEATALETLKDALVRRRADADPRAVRRLQGLLDDLTG